MSRRRAGLATALLVCGFLTGSAAGVSAGEKPVRKPGVSFLLSALVPGAGQLYNGDSRGYVYLGLEAMFWFGRFSYLDAGERREKEFQAFARRHWSLDRYRATAGDVGCSYTAANDSLIVWFLENDLQQYYEEIGKYDKFRCGWDDFASSYDPNNDRALSPNRTRYREMREQSNDLLNKARLALAGAVVNRVVSGVDAFRTARSRGRAPKTRLEGGMSGGPEPMAVIRLVRDLP